MRLILPICQFIPGSFRFILGGDKARRTVGEPWKTIACSSEAIRGKLMALDLFKVSEQ
jgi:hypothetical protein